MGINSLVYNTKTSWRYQIFPRKIIFIKHLRFTNCDLQLKPKPPQTQIYKSYIRISFKLVDLTCPSFRQINKDFHGGQQQPHGRSHCLQALRNTDSSSSCCQSCRHPCEQLLPNWLHRHQPPWSFGGSTMVFDGEQSVLRQKYILQMMAGLYLDLK